MKRLLALLAGAFGLRALLRRRAHPAFSHGGHSPSPADELRTRLAESRAVPEPASEPDAAEPTPPSVDERRTDVHDRARGAIDELKS